MSGTANNPPTGTFTIAGTATQGQTLTSQDLVSDADGTPTGRSYQWQVSTDGTTFTDIDGATDSTFTLTDATVGRSVRAEVSFTDGQGNAETVFSNVIANVADANLRPTGSLAVEGTLKVGQTVNMADLVNDDDGIASDGRTYQWQVGNAEGTSWANLPGATGNQPFTLTAAELGRPLRAVLTYTDLEGQQETFEGAASAPVAAAGNSAPTGTLALDDGPGAAPAEDTAITVNASGVADADGLGTFTYAWSREGANNTWTPIAGATGASYTPGDADVGAKLRVEASYTDGGGAKEVVSADTAAAVTNVNDAPTGAITFSGQPVRGQALTASTEALADADGIGTISLQWERADGQTWTPIAGATTPTYTLVEADVGRVLRAVATWEDKQGTDERVVAETGTVAATARTVTLPPPEEGETQENAAADELTSTDLAEQIAGGATFTPPAGVERIELADGVLSYGTGTVEAFVARIYLGLLGREGDVEGLAFVCEAVRDGVSRAAVADVFLSSAEYKARAGTQTSAEFIEDLYTAFLGRDGGAERGFWTAALDGGAATRAEVAAGIAGSAESGNHLKASTTGVFVADAEGITARSLYNCALGREADAPGLHNWSKVLDGGAADLRTLGGQFDDSAEFKARHGSSTDQAFVESLYLEGAGRPADAEGLAHWVGLLGSGAMGRGELAMYFCMSQEARNDLDWPL